MQSLNDDTQKLLEESERSRLALLRSLEEEKHAKEELRLANQELLVLNRVISESAGQHDSITILQTVLDEAIKICGLEGGTVCTVTSENTLHLTVERNTSEATKLDLQTNQIKIGECLCGHCALEQKPLILYSREDVLKFSSREVQRGEDIRFHAAFPIIIKGKSIGVLCVFTYTDAKPTERSLKLLETIVAQTAVSIENARLYENLKESEEKFATIFKVAPGSMILSSLPDGKTIEVNNNFSLITGYSREEALGKSTGDLNMWADRNARDQFLSMLQTDGVVRDFEAELNHKSGSIRNGLVSGHILTIHNKKYLIGTFYDITERKNAVEELNKNRMFIENIINASHDIIYIYDIEERKNIYINDGIQKNLGYTDQEIKQMGDTVLPTLMHPDDFNYYLQNTYPKYQTVKDKELILHEYRMQHKDGKWHWFNCKESVFLRKPDGTPKQIFGMTVDLTERKLADEALQERERQLSTLIGNLPGMAYRCRNDENYTTEFVSGKVADITGYPASDFKEQRRQFADFIHPDDRERIWSEIQNALETNQPFELIYRIFDAHGEQKWVWEKGLGIYDAIGEIHALEGFVLDITERKQAEEALRESEEKFYKAFQSSPDIIIITSLKDDRIIEVNDRLQIVTGYTNDEIIGKTSDELKFWVSPKDRKRYTELLQKNGRVRDLEVGFRIKSGEVMDTLLSGEIIDLEDGKYIIGVIRDITERKHFDMKLRSSEERFSNAFFVSPAALTITRIADGKFIDVNESFLRMFGFSRDEVIGHTSLELNILRSEERKKLIQMQIETGGLQNYELQFQTKSGKSIIMLFSSKPMVIEGEACHITTLIDITDRKIAEEQVGKSHQQLRELAGHLQIIREDERTAISREIHDELGQSLTGIKIDLAWIKTKLRKDQKPLIARVEDLNGLLDALIQNVRRISSELRPGILDDFGLIAAIEWQTQEFQRRTKIKSKFITNVESIDLDKTRTTALFRIIQESLTNVVRHAHATHLFIDVEVDMNEMTLRISDDGRGITQDEIADTKSLGLLGMKERVLLIGGSINFVRNENGGTSVVVTVPIHEHVKY